MGALSEDEDSISEEDIDELTPEEKKFANTTTTKKGLLPNDILDKISQFASGNDMMNLINTNSSMNVKRHKTPIDLSHKEITFEELTRYAAKLCKYTISSLVLYIPGGKKDEKEFKVSNDVSTILSKLTLLVLRSSVDSNKLCIHILKKCTNLTALTCDISIDNEVEDTIMALSNLNYLLIKSSKNFPARKDFFTALPNLTNLNIEGSKHVDLSKAIQVNKISISAFYGRTSITGLESCLQLQDLFLKNIKIADEKEFVFSSNLVHLELVSINSNLINLKDNTAIKSITITDSHITNVDVTNCTSLEKIHIDVFSKIDISHLKSCSKLAHLYINTHDMSLGIKSLCPSLKYFYLNSKIFSGELLKICVQLQELNLRVYNIIDKNKGEGYT